MEAAILFFTSLITMINPLASVPLFLSLTDGMSSRQMRRVVYTASLVAFALFVLLALTGPALFNFLHISLDSLKVAGSMLVLAVGYDMVRGHKVPKRAESTDGAADDNSDDIAITPLAIPMLAGPGSITVVLIFMQQAQQVIDKALLIVTLAAVMATTALVLMLGRKITTLLGAAGSRVLMRLMGLVLMMIAVELFFSGVTSYVQQMLVA